MYASPPPSSAMLMPPATSRFDRCIQRIRLFSRQTRLVLGTTGVVWVSAAGLVGLACFGGAAFEITRSLGETNLLQTKKEVAKLGALNAALDESDRALTAILLAMNSEAARVEDGEWPIRHAWARLTDDMAQICTATYGSSALTVRLDRLSLPLGGKRPALR